MLDVEEQVSRDRSINVTTLFEYARATREFTRLKPDHLDPKSQAKLCDQPVDDAPRAKVFMTSDGYRLVYRRYACAEGAPALVLVHGSGGFGDQFHAMARAISDANLAQVYTLNMRGHGLSPGKRGHEVDNAGQLVGDVAAFIEDIAAKDNGRRIILGGHSAGGGLALAVARSRVQASISGYVFLAPFLGLNTLPNRPHFGGWVDVRGIRLKVISLANLLGISCFNGATVVDFAPQVVSLDESYTARWSFNTLMGFGPGPHRDHLEPICAAKPVLVLAGGGDECFTASLYPEAFKQIAPHAELPALGRFGHWDLLVEPDAIGALSAWLKTPAVRKDTAQAMAAAA